METNKKLIIDSLEYASEKQVKFILDILAMGKYSNKQDLMKLSKIEDSGKIDTAYPIDYYRRVEDVYPNINKANLIYDYTNSIYGELVNINDGIASRILNLNK